jgi:agmatinase
VSIEIGVLDLPLVPGCASSEPNGLTYDELRQTLFAIAPGREVIGFDVVEVNPMLELDVASDNTSLLAMQLAIEFLGRIVEHPGYRKRQPKKIPAGRAAAQARRAGRRTTRAR